jgi:hypothetical protein
MSRKGTSQTVSGQTRNGKRIIGAVLLVAGSIVMLAYLSILGLQVQDFLNASPIGLMGSSVGFGLTSLRLISHLAFDHGAVYSLAYKMLVLFSAFAVILAGLALLQNRAANMVSSDRLHTQEPSNGEQ